MGKGAKLAHYVRHWSVQRHRVGDRHLAHAFVQALPPEPAHSCVQDECRVVQEGEYVHHEATGLEHRGAPVVGGYLVRQTLQGTPVFKLIARIPARSYEVILATKLPCVYVCMYFLSLCVCAQNVTCVYIYIFICSCIYLFIYSQHML